MAYKGALMVDDETLFSTMEVASQTGALVMVHAENGDLIDVLVKQALEAGNTEPLYHALTRPPEAEGEATNRAIQLAHVAGAPLYVVHVTCKEAVDPIALAREKGWDVWGETCTQYFFNWLDDIAKPNFEGAKYVYSPPVRDKANWDVLWNAVRTDALSVISTDHCAFLFDGQKTMGKDDFSKIPNGGPGLENRLHMIHEFGVARRADLAEPDGRAARDEPGEAVRPLPAQGHGRRRLRRRPRHLRPGEARDLSAATHHSQSDYNLYEGTEVTGTPEVVLLRGNVLVENDELVAVARHRAVRAAREVRRGAEAGAASRRGDRKPIRGRCRTPGMRIFLLALPLILTALLLLAACGGKGGGGYQPPPHPPHLRGRGRLRRGFLREEGPQHVVEDRGDAEAREPREVDVVRRLRDRALQVARRAVPPRPAGDDAGEHADHRRPVDVAVDRLLRRRVERRHVDLAAPEARSSRRRSRRPTPRSRARPTRATCRSSRPSSPTG